MDEHDVYTQVRLQVWRNEMRAYRNQALMQCSYVGIVMLAMLCTAVGMSLAGKELVHAQVCWCE